MIYGWLIGILTKATGNINIYVRVLDNTKHRDSVNMLILRQSSQSRIEGVTRMTEILELYEKEETVDIS